MNTELRTMLASALISIALAATPAAAADVDRSIALASGGTVEIEIASGSVRVIGWDQPEIGVSGTVGFDPGLLEVRKSAGRVSIEAPLIEGRDTSVELEIRVPELAELDIEGLSCDVTVESVRASAIRVEVVHGQILVDATARRVDVESVSGSIRTTGVIEEVRAETAAGSVVLAGVRSVATAETVSGPIEIVASAPLRQADLSTANGRIRFSGGLTDDGRLRADSMNGSVELTLDRDTRADVEVETYNGRIDVDWDGVEVGGPRNRHAEPDHDPGRSARFSLGGGGGGRIEVDTFNGRCIIRPR